MKSPCKYCHKTCENRVVTATSDVMHEKCLNEYCIRVKNNRCVKCKTGKVPQEVSYKNTFCQSCTPDSQYLHY